MKGKGGGQGRKEGQEVWQAFSLWQRSFSLSHKSLWELEEKRGPGGMMLWVQYTLLRVAQSPLGEAQAVPLPDVPSSAPFPQEAAGQRLKLPMQTLPSRTLAFSGEDKPWVQGRGL